MWKKRKDISGVSSSTIVDLKAVLYQAEQNTKVAKISGEKRPKLVSAKKTQELYIGNGSAKGKQITLNKGVNERASRDERLHQEEEDSKTWEKAQERLRQKSELYEKMVKGEILQPEDVSEERSYMVDFERKGWDLETNPSQASMMSSDMRREEERRRWEDSVKNEHEEDEAKKERMRLAFMLEEETRRGRKQNVDLKTKRKRDMEERLRLIKEKQKRAAANESKTDANEQNEKTFDENEKKENEETEEKEENIDEHDVEDFLKMMRGDNA